MVRQPRRPVDAAVLVALASLASLVVHQFAYLFAYPTVALRTAALGDHGHLSAQWAIVTPLAVTAAVAIILRQVRNLGVSSPFRARWLALLAGSAFLGQETIEGIGAGLTFAEIVTQPAIWLGVALAPMVSMVILRLLRRVGDFVAEKARARVNSPCDIDAAIVSPQRVRVSSAVFESVAAPRGPPASSVRF